MTEWVVQLPDDLAQRAKSAGLLSDVVIQRLLEEAMRREAGAKLMQLTAGLHAANIEPITEDEIVAEVKAVRAARRAPESQGKNSNQS